MSISIQTVRDLLSGKTVSMLREEAARLQVSEAEIGRQLEQLHGHEQSINRQLETLETIQNGGREAILEAITGLVQRSDITLPKLRQLVIDRTPSHRSTPLLMAALRANVPVWIYGDAGSGKTTAASKAAELLNLNFRFVSVCPTTTKSELFGYMDAGGTYRGTAFREIFEHGGVFLIDEIDNGNPSVLSVLNTAIANGYCAFPDGNIKRHEETRIVAAANTIGHGADIRYVGRNAIDATTLDRFVFVRMDIDENFERALIGGAYDIRGIVDITEGGQITVEEWHRFVVKVRGACKELGIEHLVTPRATLYGRQLIAAGIGRKHLEEMCIWKGLRETDRTKISEFMGRS